MSPPPCAPHHPHSPPKSRFFKSTKTNSPPSLSPDSNHWSRLTASPFTERTNAITQLVSLDQSPDLIFAEETAHIHTQQFHRVQLRKSPAIPQCPHPSPSGFFAHPRSSPRRRAAKIKATSTPNQNRTQSPQGGTLEIVVMAPMKTLSNNYSSSNYGESVARQANVLASCYLVDSAGSLKGLHYCTTGVTGT